MRRTIKNVETLAQLMQEYEQLHKLVDSFNDALSVLTAGNQGVSVQVGASTAVDLTLFDEDDIRLFLVSLLNKTIDERDSYDEKIFELTELLK